MTNKEAQSTHPLKSYKREVNFLSDVYNYLSCCIKTVSQPAIERDRCNGAKDFRIRNTVRLLSWISCPILIRKRSCIDTRQINEFIQISSTRSWSIMRSYTFTAHRNSTVNLNTLLYTNRRYNNDLICMAYRHMMFIYITNNVLNDEHVDFEYITINNVRSKINIIMNR